eukprot:13995575-Alexandrium_andersonii.AAC.1
MAMARDLMVGLLLAPISDHHLDLSDEVLRVRTCCAIALVLYCVPMCVFIGRVRGQADSIPQAGSQ